VFKKILVGMLKIVKEFFIELYYSELGHIDNYYRQYR